MENDTYFLLPNKHRKFEKIPFSEILYLQGNINYTLIHLQSGKVKISPRTLRFHVNNSLDNNFIRIHRAFCVNRSYIQSYDEKESSNFLLLTSGTKLAVSRRKKRELLKIN
jgi:two-component system LytT family response regulator